MQWIQDPSRSNVDNKEDLGRENKETEGETITTEIETNQEI